MNPFDKKLWILDKDSTLVKPGGERTFPLNYSDQELLPQVFTQICRFTTQGGKCAIASNQGGVESGYKTIQDAINEMWYCMSLLDGMVPFACFCPDFQGDHLYVCHYADQMSDSLEKYEFFATANNRKPQPGMLDYIVRQHASLLESNKNWREDVLMIGDRPEDEGAAKILGIDYSDHTEVFK